MRVIVAGATGFIGNSLCRLLVETGHDVVALTRNPAKGMRILGDRVRVAQWDGKSAAGWEGEADGAGAIVNLAGEGIGEDRWTREKKRRILQSRLDAGSAVLEAVELAEKKPGVVIQASGIGYYGSRGDEPLDESDSPGQGFIPDVARQWDRSTEKVASYGVRHVVIRSGVVLGPGGGALPRMALPFRFFLGGPIGSGKQWISWIHLDDEVSAIRFLMEGRELHGAFNLSAPEPLPMAEFSRALGRAISRPSWLPVPGFAVRAVLGEMADYLLLTGQRAQPKKLTDAGFSFGYSDVESALRDALKG